MNTAVAPLSKMGENEPLTLLQLLVLFILWGLGLSIAIITFIGEIWDVKNVTLTLCNLWQHQGVSTFEVISICIAEILETFGTSHM